MGFPQEIKGHVDSLSRAINVPNAQANATGVAEVNPVFTWVRLAQRVPVRIHLDVVPEGVRLVQGMTATVQVHPLARQRSRSDDDHPNGGPGALVRRDWVAYWNGFP
jgi:multidrug resistance efflux pump